MTAPAIEITTRNGDGTEGATVLIEPDNWKYEQLVCLAVCTADDGEAEFYIDGKPVSCEQARAYLFANAHGEGTFDYDADHETAEAQARASAAKALAEFTTIHAAEIRLALLDGVFATYARNNPALLAVAQLLDADEIAEITAENLKLDSATVFQIGIGDAIRSGVFEWLKFEGFPAAFLGSLLDADEERIARQSARSGQPPSTHAEYFRESPLRSVHELLSS